MCKLVFYNRQIWEQTFREMFGNNDITESEEAANDIAGLPLDNVSHIKLITKFVYMLLPYAAATWSKLYHFSSPFFLLQVLYFLDENC
jgi:hypothetical protein